MEALRKINDKVEMTEPVLVVYLLDQTLSNFTSTEDEHSEEFAMVCTIMYVNIVEEEFVHILHTVIHIIIEIS